MESLHRTALKGGGTETREYDLLGPVAAEYIHIEIADFALAVEVCVCVCEYEIESGYALYSCFRHAVHS